MASVHSFPTPTVVRIKRRLGSESSESIIVSSKRKRLCEDDDNPIPNICTAIFKKLTTLNSSDSLEIETKKAIESEVKHSWDLKETYKKGISSSAKDLIRKRAKSDVAAIRFKLICSRRNLDQNEFKEGAPSEAIDFHLLDALKEKEENLLVPIASSSNSADIIACNGVPMEREKVEYVYDLYYTSLPFEISTWIHNICEIQKYNALDYTDECSKESNDPDYDDDDDDENEESNWRNDYPDEEEGDLYEDEDDYICRQMEKAKINESEESYDAEDYDESGDFDEDGNLVLYNQSSGSVFGWSKKKVASSSSSDSEAEGDDQLLSRVGN